MRKFFVCLLSILVLNNGTAFAHNLADTIERVIPAVTYIRSRQFVTVKEVNLSTKEVVEKEVEVTPIIGSGFVIENNIIVTNHHVIEKAIRTNSEILVSFIDGTLRYTATVIGYDKITDVALLQIEGDHPSVNIPPYNDLRMGAEIFTISHFYGIGWSATNGIVSSIHRADPRYPYINNLQLQILSGTGSSGGPVFDMKGNVVGLNRSIVSMFPRVTRMSGGTSMLSMVAFPIRGDSLLEAIKRIKEETIVERVDLGVQLIPFGNNSSYHTNEDPTFFTGVIVYRKDSQSNTTLQASDLIISLDHQTFTDPGALLKYLDENYEPGDVVKLHVYRDEKLINIDVTLEAVGV